MSLSVCRVLGGGSGLEKLSAAGYVDASSLVHLSYSIITLKEPTVVRN